MSTRRVAVVGAGIKGASLAALLSVDPDPNFHVTLIDAGAIGGGTTATNHGRLHLGTANWRTDSVALMRRRHRGSCLWRLMDVLGTAAPAVYAFRNPDDLDHFRAKADEAGIPIRDTGFPHHPWLDSAVVATVELAEHSFNPARVAGRAAQFAADRGVTILPNSPAAGIDLDHGACRLHLPTGRRDFDLVVSCAGRWSHQLLPDGLPTIIDIEWFQWNILVARNEHLPPLDRVLVYDDAELQSPSVVPHGPWLTFDTKMPTKRVASTHVNLHHVPGLVDADTPDDHEMLAACRHAFPALRAIDSVCAAQGIQGRQVGASAGSTAQLLTHPQHPEYIVAFGGQASTALLDAYDCAVELWKRGILALDPNLALGALIRDLPRSPIAGTAAMVWEELSLSPRP